ncbi:MAG TPA: hypothetical protein VFZ41_01395 [Solirubrobacterales bacterium]
MPLKRLLATVATVVALLAAPAAAQAPVAAQARAPAGFIGISPQSEPTDSDYELMEQAGLRSVRLPLFWLGVEPVNPFWRRPNWSGFDQGVEVAARHGMRVLPFVWGSPTWVAPEALTEPVDTVRQRRAWTSFLRRAVRRYGRNGVFWRQNPELPHLPIRSWEIWNEQNIVTFGRADPERFARLIQISGRVLRRYRRYDPGARLILGGLFGRPLQVPPNVQPGQFMARLYQVRGIKRWFDGIGLHPYVAQARAMRGQIRNLRRVMRLNGDGGTPLYVTEMGWGSNGFESRWERGLRGQARELHQAFAMLTNNRYAWRIGGVWWFSWADQPGSHCQFCDSAGLLTVAREAKPSWYVFNRWTGGDARVVPRASFGR